MFGKLVGPDIVNMIENREFAAVRASLMALGLVSSGGQKREEPSGVSSCLRDQFLVANAAKLGQKPSDVGDVRRLIRTTSADRYRRQIRRVRLDHQLIGGIALGDLLQFR